MIMKARARFKRLGLGPVVAAALAQWAATRCLVSGLRQAEHLGGAPMNMNMNPSPSMSGTFPSRSMSSMSASPSMSSMGG